MSFTIEEIRSDRRLDKSHCKGNGLVDGCHRCNGPLFKYDMSSIAYVKDYTRLNKRHRDYVAFGFVAYFVNHYIGELLNMFDEYYNTQFKKYRDRETRANPMLAIEDSGFLKRQFYNEHLNEEHGYIDQIREKKSPYKIERDEIQCIDIMFDSIYNYLSDERIGIVEKNIDAYFKYIENYYMPQLTTTVQPVIKCHNAAAIQKPESTKTLREINIEKLKRYFKSQFKGTGNCNIDYFSWLIEGLKTDRTSKEFAQIALIIYYSDKLKDKPNTFSEWYGIFCDAIGIKKVNGYKPCNLNKNNEKLKNLFSYL